MALTLDVTGFYFAETVPFSGQNTVQQVMEAVARKTAATGTKFDYGPRLGQTLPGQKLDFIRVEFTCDPPRSRQVDRNGVGAEKQDRLFFFDDSNQQLMGPTDQEQAQFQLAWQYYVKDKNGALKSGGAAGRFRRIVAFSDPAPDYTLADGDVIVWRLVAIFSVNANVSGQVAVKQGGPSESFA